MPLPLETADVIGCVGMSRVSNNFSDRINRLPLTFGLQYSNWL